MFLAVGVLGFVPGITTHYDQLTFAGHHSDAALLAIFNVSVLHNLAHLAFGVAGIALARKPILIWAARAEPGKDARRTSADLAAQVRLGPPPAAGYATAEDSSATLLQRAWTESRQRRVVFSRDQ